MQIFRKIFLKKKSLYTLSPKNFNHKKWISLTKNRIQDNYKKLKSKKFSEYRISSPLLLIALLQFKNKKLRILDVGSGDLKSYFTIYKYRNFFKQTFFHSIELSKIVQLYKGYNFLNKGNKISFTTSEEIKSKKYDIIHISDSLHYISDWRITLKKIIKLSPKYIIINSTRAGKIPTFASFQNFYKSEVPTWFFNEKEILSLFKKRYTLLYNEEFINTILGNFGKLPLDNFDKKFRIENSKSFIFIIKNSINKKIHV
jgi:putative methyltransferase (TIGR04325 family)